LNGLKVIDKREDTANDPVLIQRNFTGRPAAHIESLDLAASRLKQPRKPKP